MIGFKAAALVVTAVTAASVLITHFAFSVIATMIFLRPLMVVLSVKAGGRSDVDKRLQQTIRWTLAGTSVVVLGSSLVCKCCLLCI